MIFRRWLFRCDDKHFSLFYGEILAWNFLSQWSSEDVHSEVILSTSISLYFDESCVIWSDLVCSCFSVFLKIWSFSSFEYFLLFLSKKFTIRSLIALRLVWLAFTAALRSVWMDYRVFSSLDCFKLDKVERKITSVAMEVVGLDSLFLEGYIVSKNNWLDFILF